MVTIEQQGQGKGTRLGSSPPQIKVLLPSTWNRAEACGQPRVAVNVVSSIGSKLQHRLGAQLLAPLDYIWDLHEAKVLRRSHD